MTRGLFVVVRVEVSATGPEVVETADTRVLSKHRRYDSFGISSTGQAEPGFVSSVDVVFEVDPADIDDLTLEIYPLEVVSGYAQHSRIHLGITRRNAGQWRAAGQNQVVETLEFPTVRAI